MRIAISSMSGCGNTTISSLLSSRLGYKLINYTFRQMADERNVDFKTFCAMAENDYSIDRELDRRQVEMAMKEKNCVLGSRLAIWVLDKADYKIYLRARVETRAGRIQNREGGSFEKKLQETIERDARDTNRYKIIYNIDNTKPESVADLIIDTDDISQDEVLDIILGKIKGAV